MSQQTSPFVTMPRNSRIDKTNCKSTILNTSKNNNLCVNCSINDNKFSFINYNNNHLKIDYTNIRSVLNKTKASSTVFCNNLNPSSKNVLLKVSYTNIRSILNKISFVECYMCTKNIDLFFLTETWLTPTVIDSNFCPLGYSIIRNDRLSRGRRCCYF